MKLNALFVAAMLGAAPAAAALPSSVYVFGDSFVDSGNAFLGTGGMTAQPELGYFEGRFSNGPNFADFVSRRLTGGLATARLAGGTNYAIGGARAAGDAQFGPFTVLGLPNQLALYGSDTGGAVDPDGLYILNFGNNDVNAIQSGDTYGLSAFDYGQRYTSNIVNTILGLNAGGATRIVVLGVPNPTEAEGVALQAQLDAGLDAIAPSLTADLTRFDFFDFFGRLQASPIRFNLPADVDFTTPCIPTRPVVNGEVDCTGYFSFDGTHVISTVQREIARELLVAAGLPTIPEPAVWVQMIAGFGLAGGALRAARASKLRETGLTG